MSDPAPYNLPGDPTPLSTSEIQILIDEGKLLRILRPDLKENIQRAVMANDSDNPQLVDHLLDHVVEHDGEIYLSFRNIDDPGRREETYRLVQQLQTGGTINTALLPAPLRAIMEQGFVRRNRLTAAFVLCALAGVASGVMAMAISVLATTVLNTPPGEFAGMDVTAIVFVVFCVLGWFSSATILWTKARKPGARNPSQRENMYS